MKRQIILTEIEEERLRQISKGTDGSYDKNNSKNDWIAYINAYTGRAADRVFKNAEQNEGFRENIVKVAALAVAALESYDKGYLNETN